MTRARYNSSDNTLKEISQMEKPLRPPNREKYGSHEFDYERDWFNYNGNTEIYNEHIASLRTLPCQPESGFKDGEKYTEGKDYEVKGAGDWKWCTQLKGNVFAAPIVPPIVPVKSEDDPYEELVTMIARSSWNRNEIIAEAKKQFIVTKR